jgi:polyribonucleotide nucleotidyltransferase
MIRKVEIEVGGKKLSLETGWMAKQADGAVVGRYGDTVVLTTVVSAKQPKAGCDFLPLTVDYQEKAYAAGRIPGSYFRREGRPTEREILNSRLIDRPLRPLFPDGFYNETFIVSSVLSADQCHATELLGIASASAALLISDIPFHDPVAAVRVGRIGGAFVINPGFYELDQSDMNLVVAGTHEAILMVEAGLKEVSEEVILEALELGHGEIRKIIAIQKELREQAGKPKRTIAKVEINPEIVAKVESICLERVRQTLLVPNKTERQNTLDDILSEAVKAISPEEQASERARDAKLAFHQMESREMRRMVIEKGIRADGRGASDIRPITCQVGVLPRTHGSALFTRGETQSLAVVTLGTSDDEQRIETLEGETTKTFMLHYNFPPFSVGEARFLRGPGRREIGHGALAERALHPVIPNKEVFPYTLRIVSDILESNGSSSMATVCGGTLALMDAGVPIKSPVAGIAMGLIQEGDRTVVLSDILGVEDHLGDMDFKVTGTAQGVTALQMDSKIAGIHWDVMRQALRQAREGRLWIMSKMLEALATHRENLSVHAPRIFTMKIKTDKIREVIGPGGKVIRGIVEKTGVKIDIEDSGLISIAAMDSEAADRAIAIIKSIVEEPEIGRIYRGTVKKVMDFGAFVEIKPGVEGLVHISQLAEHRVQTVSDEVAEGDEIWVKVLEVDRQGKIRLSRKEAMREKQGETG